MSKDSKYHDYFNFLNKYSPQTANYLLQKMKEEEERQEKAEKKMSLFIYNLHNEVNNKMNNKQIKIGYDKQLSYEVTIFI
jgi:hypothetical protein